MNFSFVSSNTTGVDLTVVGVYQDGALTADAEALNARFGSALSRSIERSTFEGKIEQTLLLTYVHADCEYAIMLMGLGAIDELSEVALTKCGGAVAVALKTVKADKIEFLATGVMAKDMNQGDIAAHIMNGMKLRSWEFSEYFTADDKKTDWASHVTCVTTGVEAAEKAFKDLAACTDGTHFARDLMCAPPNILTPTAFAEQLLTLKKMGVTVEVLGEKKMKALGMGALLGVGQGSAQESQLVVMQWNGGPKDQAPVAFVGKGVTFDTGGISIKPSGNMHEMKYDMGGAAAVSGLMKSVAGRQAKANVVGVVGLVENMPGDNAQRPGDVVTSMSGQTIEVLNTDAEGRLVLADAIWYTQDRFKPQAIVDLATLTMAIIIALGHDFGGLFSNDDGVADKLFKAGQDTDEKLWRLPLTKEFDADINSDIADMQNIQKTPSAAGSITAGQLLQRFANDVPWAHLDIAGTAWTGKDTSYCQRGANGYGVRLLDRFVRDNFEVQGA